MPKTTKTLGELAKELADVMITAEENIADMDRATADIDKEIHETEEQLSALHNISLDIAGEYLIVMSQCDIKIDGLKAQIIEARDALKHAVR
jgi:predicted  nucleic acid-binding Zn-ribbon protein